MSKTDEVVGAAIIRDGRVYLVQRKPGKSFPWGWECPGGRVEAHDGGLLQALDRELREEIGISFVSTDGREMLMPELIYKTEFKVGEFGMKYPMTYYMFAVTQWFGEPKPMEGQPGHGWFDANGMLDLWDHLLPANQRAFSRIKELL